MMKPIRIWVAGLFGAAPPARYLGRHYVRGGRSTRVHTAGFLTGLCGLYRIGRHHYVRDHARRDYPPVEITKIRRIEAYRGRVAWAVRLAGHPRDLEFETRELIYPRAFCDRTVKAAMLEGLPASRICVGITDMELHRKVRAALEPPVAGGY